ncbi:hypothetical protein BDA96_03G078400 [Sorghum bicolor]|uniref:Uncharacterized protein n=2 Tax=Sorghum bicolor TaxID=4558 RepID=A0A921RCQ3_SORBI|nr:hypothetical protein BDA96_03G078400 [Sorghum bicolor]OQU86334.1 hypothetical protein SORBI_3003G074801 [Sorghum bicolor]
MFYKALFFRTRHGVPFQSPQRQTPDLQNYCLFGMRILEAGIYLQNDGYQLGSSVSYSYTTLTQAAETHYIYNVIDLSLFTMNDCMLWPALCFVITTYLCVLIALVCLLLKGFKALFGCSRIHINPHVLRWIRI